MEFDLLSKRVIGRALEVHKALGPGLLESAYERCLSYELSAANILFQSQYPLPLEYKGIKLDCGYRADILIENQIIIEIKSVETLLPVHEAQILTYMKIGKIPIGLLMNFNVKQFKMGLKRFVL